MKGNRRGALGLAGCLGLVMIYFAPAGLRLVQLLTGWGG